MAKKIGIIEYCNKKGINLDEYVEELKKKVAEETNDLYNLMHTIREMNYAKQDNNTKRYDYWNKRLGQIIHIQPYGKVKS